MLCRLLVIDQYVGEPSFSKLLPLQQGFSCHQAHWDSIGSEELNRPEHQLIVAVTYDNPRQTLNRLEWIAKAPVAKPCFAVVSQDIAPETLRSVSDLADEFVLWPGSSEESLARIRRLLHLQPNDLTTLSERLSGELAFAQLIGRDPVFLRVLEKIPALARSPVPVLITGETGTGKELTARAIHNLGSRRNYPFIAVDCGAVPDHLFENEMFGHARGGYTDAHRDQKGLVSMAEGGTLFLDEIDALSLAAQAKLLRFLQERTFKPLGSDRFSKASLNIIAAANRDLETCVRERLFRADLFYRLNGLRLTLPPLRDRRLDIELLATHFLDAFCDEARLERKTFSKAAVRKLSCHTWPGNVRELFNVVQQSALFCDGSHVLPDHIPLARSTSACSELPTGFRAAREEAIRSFEREYVEQLLANHGGNVTHAAREARKDRRAFGRLVKKYSIKRK